ncbi:unnamed protein product [Heterosigma akashiwo]
MHTWRTSAPTWPGSGPRSPCSPLHLALCHGGHLGGSSGGSGFLRTELRGGGGSGLRAIQGAVRLPGDELLGDGAHLWGAPGHAGGVFSHGADDRSGLCGLLLCREHLRGLELPGLRLLTMLEGGQRRRRGGG